MAGCGFSCAKYTLFVFNALFWLAGAAILAIGIWLAVDPNILEYLELGDFEKDDEQLKWAAYFLIAAGGAIFILGFCGCCGAIRESQCLLGFYAICILGIIGLQIAAGVYAYLKRDEIIKAVEDKMIKGITDVYDGENSMSITWHKAMIEFKCCGVTGPANWAITTKWDKPGGQIVPKACCVLTNDDPEDPKPKDNVNCQSDANPLNPTDTENLYSKGCSESIKEWVKNRAVILIAVGFAVAAFELLVLILALCVCCQIRRKE